MAYKNIIKQHNPSGRIADRIIKENAYVCALIGNQLNDKRAYFIVRFDKAKYQEFERLFEQGKLLNLGDYGEILYSGWNEPSQEEKVVFREKYGLYQD